jgi:hypothetical protein
VAAVDLIRGRREKALRRWLRETPVKDLMHAAHPLTDIGNQPAGGLRSIAFAITQAPGE